MKKKESGSKPPTSGRPRIQKDFLKHGRVMDADAETIRRDNLTRLVGTEAFPTWKSISDALGYADQSRISHLKNGYRHISAAMARGIEEKLGLARGYFDQDPNKARTDSVVAGVDRRAAARRYLDRSATAKELAAEFEVEEALIYRWVAELRQKVGEATTEPASSGRSVAELEEENRKLKDRLLKFMLAED